MPTIELPGGTLSGFEVAGPTEFFRLPRLKSQEKNKVDVSCPQDSAPVSVRYPWAGAPTCNLYNKIKDHSGEVIDGLPASPFRSQGIDNPESGLPPGTSR